jgi:hypothetical protein
MGPIGCAETSVTNYHYSLRNDPEECSSHLLRGGSLKSSIDMASLILQTGARWRSLVTSHPGRFTPDTELWDQMNPGSYSLYANCAVPSPAISRLRTQNVSSSMQTHKLHDLYGDPNRAGPAERCIDSSSSSNTAQL